ncbi:Forkhead box protein M1 [Liparis tanakae]|uniref:Forkhead box protein M1 n=1 Tax=Liparis tanakae TaxID=230148 RepID=A0A4Z2HV61_9TELE|nr:Forkhead box protein M1 [Liparis tanakae]
MAMRRSPRRPLILRRRKLPFQQNEPPPAEPRSRAHAPGFKEPPKSLGSQCFPNGIRIMDHPSMSDTQVVVIPTTADLHSVIGALTAKGKECGVHGPNKFILLSGNGSRDNGSFCQPAAEEVDVSALGQPVKEESAHCSLDVKPLTGTKACMEIRIVQV